MRNVAIGLGALLLAGCMGQPVQQANEIGATDTAGGNGTAPVGAPTPLASPTAAPVVSDGTIPASFQGRWGLVPADCTSKMGDNKGLMTVTADRLSFYESRATIAKLTAVSPTELRVSLAFTGEGQEWTQDTPLVLEDNGSVLTRVADGQTLRYTRCSA